MFYFPIPTAGDRYYTVQMPFFENVSIQESKRARYQKYSLISRSSNLYSYLGADSRVLNLKFNISLPHLLEEHPNINFDDNKYITYDKENVEAQKEKFKEPYKPDLGGLKSMASILGIEYTTTEEVQNSVRQVINSLTTSGTGVTLEEKTRLLARYGIKDNDLKLEVFQEYAEKQIKTEEVLNPITFAIKVFGAINQATLGYKKDQQVKYRIIDLIIYWTNIIRSSVVNYSKNPIYGPPIIRLNHGIMYQNIPCICTNYSINHNEAAGYDIDTLLPRQLTVNLKLEELRAGDFGDFIPKGGNPIERDNLAGWEAVVLGETNSMDPGYPKY